jgi:metal-responsive CopG/Arc/MetJ family transcriptional regulator
VRHHEKLSINTTLPQEKIMPKIEVDLSQELNDRLMSFVVKSRGSLYVQRSDVVIDAIKEYLDRNERKVRRSNG